MEEPTVPTSDESHSQTSNDDPVVAQQRQALKDYETNSIRVYEDAKGELREQRDYAERPLLELLQNAEDALADAKQEGAVLLDLSDNRLLVANQGAKFTPRGFGALCTLHNSPKPADKHCRFIGSKGTGFKAVLNWTETPEIFSGPIQARFDRTAAAELIEEAIGERGRKNLEQDQKQPWPEIAKPLLRVPIATEPDAEIRRLRADGWTTIIRLPVRSDQLTTVAQALDELEPRQLLFLNCINRVVLKRNEVTNEWQLRRTRTPHLPHITCEEVDIRHGGRPFATWHLLRRTLPKMQIPGSDAIDRATGDRMRRGRSRNPDGRTGRR